MPLEIHQMLLQKNKIGFTGYINVDMKILLSFLRKYISNKKQNLQYNLSGLSYTQYALNKLAHFQVLKVHLRSMDLL